MKEKKKEENTHCLSSRLLQSYSNRMVWTRGRHRGQQNTRESRQLIFEKDAKASQEIITPSTGSA